MVLVQVQLYEIGTEYGLEILQQRGKTIKLKFRKFIRLIPPFGEVTGENLASRTFLTAPS